MGFSYDPPRVNMMDIDRNITGMIHKCLHENIKEQLINNAHSPLLPTVAASLHVVTNTLLGQHH